MDRKPMTGNALRVTMVVLAHTIVSVVHGKAHQHLQIPLGIAPKIFILLVITIMPLMAMALIWSPWIKVSSALLVTSMMGSLVFGILYHFMIPGPDHVLHQAANEWRTTFQITAALLALIEIAGCWIGSRTLLRSDA